MAFTTNAEFRAQLHDVAQLCVDTNSTQHRSAVLQLIDLAPHNTAVVAPIEEAAYDFRTAISDLAGIVIGNYLDMYRPGIENPFSDIFLTLSKRNRRYLNFGKIYEFSNKQHSPIVLLDVKKQHGIKLTSLEIQMMREAGVFNKLDYMYHVCLSMRAIQNVGKNDKII